MKLLVCLLALVIESTLFDVHLDTAAKKCYFEDVTNDTLVVAEAFPKNGIPVSFTVSMHRPVESFFNDTSVKPMKTAFTAPRKGFVEVCLKTVPQHTKAIVNLRIVSGALARDFSQVARKVSLDPVVAELRTIEGMLTEYRDKQLYLVYKDSDVRRLTDSTHTRVVTLTVVNVLVLLISSVATVTALRSFFRAKKLI